MWLVAIAVAMALPLLACIDLGANAGPSVAILDLDKLALGAGLKDQLQAALNETEGKFKAQFEAAKQQATKELKARRQQYGVVPTVAQQRELRAFAEGKKMRC